MGSVFIFVIDNWKLVIGYCYHIGHVLTEVGEVAVNPVFPFEQFTIKGFDASCGFSKVAQTE